MLQLAQEGAGNIVYEFAWVIVTQSLDAADEAGPGAFFQNI